MTASVDFDDVAFATAGGGTTTSTTTTPSPTTSTAGVTSSTVPASSTTSTTLAPTFVGTGKAETECYVTLAGIQATSGTQADCVDGDPVCDRDASADGVCTFGFRVCVAQPLGGCQATSITSVKGSPASLAIPVPPVPATGPTCGADAQVAVPLRRQGRAAGRRTLSFVARLDRDRVRLRCLPTG